MMFSKVDFCVWLNSGVVTSLPTPRMCFFTYHLAVFIKSSDERKDEIVRALQDDSTEMKSFIAVNEKFKESMEIVDL